VIAFPDDDCWYGPNLLEDVARLLTAGAGTDGVTGRSVDESGAESSGSFARTLGPVRLDDVWSKGISYTIFLRRGVCQAVGDFDEELGVGAQTPFGSGEETDYLIRALKLGTRLEYRPDLLVFHPNGSAHANASTLAKAFHYGAGMGRVLVKHSLPLTQRARALARPLAGSLWAACLGDTDRSRLRWSTARGRLSGMWRSW
jgi:GT2 family glycosyltransferase